MALVKLGTDVLQFEKQKHEREMMEGEKDTVEKREERADSNKFALKKFKQIMDAFRSQKQ